MSGQHQSLILKKTFYKIRDYLTIGIWIVLKEFYNSGFVLTYYDSALNRECQDIYYISDKYKPDLL